MHIKNYFPEQITLNVNNNGVIALCQREHDKAITLSLTHDGNICDEWTISPGEMVMLMNYYRNCKEGIEDSSYILPLIGYQQED